MTRRPPINREPEAGLPPALVERLQSFATTVGPDLERRFLAGEPDPDSVKLLASSGLLGLTIPPRYGGLGLDYPALGAASEALGRLDLSYQISLTVHLGLVAMTVMQWGSAAQRQRLLPALAAGTEIATFALTEPGAGTDVSALSTRAVPDCDGYRLSGEKTWISGASDSSLFLIFATTDTGRRHQGITAFIVPRASRGLTTPALHGKLGIRAGDTGSVVLNDVWVPASELLGDIGDGFPIALSALATGLFTVGYGALGIICACRSLALEILQQASAGSTAAIGQLERQAIAMMTSREATARQLLIRAATLKNRGLPSQRETSLAKWTAADGAVAVAEAALTIAQRYQDERLPTLERHLRNAKGAVIYGGTAQIHQVMQGAYATGDRHERPTRRPQLTARHLASATELEAESPG